MGNLGLVHGHDHDEHTNTKPSDSSTSIEEGQALSSSLQSAADAEDNGADHDGHSPAEPVAKGTSDGSSKEATASEKRDNGTTVDLSATV
jgi:hypothetical protein